jgi:hypothetical protein
VNVHTSSCGLLVGVAGVMVMPLTPCCQAPAGTDPFCSRCLRDVEEGYTFAAIIGHRDFERDLQNMLEKTTRCTDRSCAHALAEEICAGALDHTHADAVGSSA